MKEELKRILKDAITLIDKADSTDKLEEIRIKILGKKGDLTKIMRGMGKLSKEERPVVGKLANEVRTEIEQKMNMAVQLLEEKALNEQLKSETIDVTLPGKKVEPGNRHPLSIVLKDIESIFMGMGFKVAQGPEIETVYNNFDALNAPKNHPSRSESDTFYITDNLLLRTQTSPVQIRTMKKTQPPVKVISPGRCFRFDEIDATHSPMFHQIEGLVIDEDITMADLKGTLNLFVQRLFGSNIKTKFRPHYFPFTEPSAEVDVTCFKCQGQGCKVCGNSGWIEILGCGMVHPNVLEECGIDSEKYSGFAFGMGLDRITMLKYEIDDIRLFFENDVRFLKQFK